MSSKRVKARGLSSSTQSAKSRTRKTSRSIVTPEVSPTIYDQVEVVLGPSHSRLANLYKKEEFATEWANNVPFHIARNILHLRRHRGWSQSKLAHLVGTSQSAIARIENGHENITVDTLQRIVAALDGRFYISISPKELPDVPKHPWWERVHEKAWSLMGWVSFSGTDTDQLIVGLERPKETLVSSVSQMLPQTASIPGRA